MERAGTIDIKKGLGQSEAESLLLKYGENTFETKKKQSKILLLLKNFNNPLVYVLFVAGLITLALGHHIDSAVIFFVTVINAIIGYIQENKAEKALEALKKMSLAHVTVIRDGKKEKITSNLIVPGDLVYLEEGDKIPADGIILKCNNLQVNEAVLTGESLPIEKSVKNKIFMSTTVVSGNAFVSIETTAINTEFGKIAKLVEGETDSTTPLQKKMESFGRKLGIFVLAVCFLVFIVGLLSGQDVLTMFEISVSLAVSAIPEGLPVAITVILVLGMKRMAKNKAIVRNLTAVETLGTTTIIASDKTGTITHNKMTVTETYSDTIYSVSGDGYGLKGYFHKNFIKIDPRRHLKLLMTAGVLANNGEIRSRGGKTEIFGDPTDCAILVSAYKAGIKKEDLSESTERLVEIPFTSEQKYMAVLVDEGGAKVSYMKGAFEEVVKRCNYIHTDEESKVIKMTLVEAQKLSKVVNEMTSRGLRVIALAYREEGFKKDTLTKDELDSGYVFVGLIGMRDTYRMGIKESIAECKKAGIRIIMLTGDHIETATIIGKEIGILDDEAQAISAEKIEKMSMDEIQKVVKEVSVYARISPTAKYLIIEALKKNGEIVAMTGDGVNDVPALKKADIGVAMGIMGTEASKDASDMVLTDDNFTTIVTAVGEGRTIFENIRKTIYYLLSTNLGEVITVLSGMIMGFGLVLEPLQILWMNMVTDTAATIPLGMEPAEEDHTLKPPRHPKEPIVNAFMLVRILIVSLTMAAIALYVYTGSLSSGQQYAKTMTFLVLVIAQWFNALNAKSEKKSIFTMHILNNKALIYGLLIAATIQLAVMYIPGLSTIFGLAFLSLFDWLKAIVLGAAIILVIEAQKLITHLISKSKT